jgi:N-carbamoyl-L-amino-acid hydrolase
MHGDLVGLDHAAQPRPGIAARFLARLREAAGPHGICRDSYGSGEQHAHDVLAEMAMGLRLLVERDQALNLYVTRAGIDRSAPVMMLGSHLDSVPDGGNFDGAAGVAAGLAILAGLTPLPCDVTLMAIRAEEAAWFDVSYAGSRAAFGQLSASELALPRADTGKSLADHMRALGGDPDAVLSGPAFLRPERIRAFLELHIEQGPVLEHAGLPVGIVAGIAGCRRFRSAHCVGRAAHSGAEPLAYRSDPVAATIQLIALLDEAARQRPERLTFTVGELYTDPASHGPSRIAGEIRFVLDWRGVDEVLLDEMQRLAEHSAAQIGEAYRVRFELGPALASAPASMDVTWQARLEAAARRAGIAAKRMQSGAGHDASVFANAGVPSAMLFVRSRNGSHNPQEAMEIEDLAAATTVARNAIIDSCPSETWQRRRKNAGHG